jgi:hypothetical protein
MEIRAEVRIDAPARTAWAVLGDQFGEIGQWAGPIVYSSLDSPPGAGAVRTCQIASFGPFQAGTIKERLLQFDPTAMTLEYESAEGMPAFVSNAVNRWSVHAETASRCVVRTHATLDVRGPIRAVEALLRIQLRRNGVRVLEELRYRVEHGRPHPRKLAAT